MADAYLRQGPLAHLGLAARAVSPTVGIEEGVVLCERPARGQIGLRGDAGHPAFRTAVKEVLGFVPPTKATTAAGGTGLPRALWLGPDEWLVVGPPGSEGKIARDLRVALAGQHAAVTDVSEGRTVIGLAGRHARDVLMKGCPLDLHSREFKPGGCAQSALAKALIILHQTGDAPAYDIYIERSMADYLWSWLEDAAEEYGLAVVKG